MPRHTLLTLRAENAALQAQITALSVSPFGVLTVPALRWHLARTAGPVDLVAIDIRKMHELNSVLGWDPTTGVVAALLATRAGPGRPVDLVGQLGGDEFLFVLPPGDALGFLPRLLRRLVVLSGTLTPDQSDALRARTGGLVRGIAAAIVVVGGARRPFLTAERLPQQLLWLKNTGPLTGDRATSGAAGTVIAWMDEAALY